MEKGVTPMNLRRILLGMILAILTIFTTHEVVLEASTADTLVVHYHRYDENYTDWSVWLWQEGIQGLEVQFDGEDSYGKTVSVNLSQNGFTNTQDIGIIVAQIPDSGNWNKDIDIDRYIDLDQPNASGEVHAYVMQGVEFISYTATDQVGCDRDNLDPYLCAQEPTTGLIDAYFNSNNDLVFLSTDPVSAADITVYQNGNPVTFTGFTSGTTGALDLDLPVQLADIYEIEVDIAGTLIKQLVRVDADFDSTRFATAYHYDGPLGMEYTPTATTFRLWAPLSSLVRLNLYTAGHTTLTRADGADDPYDVVVMDYIGSGVFEAVVPGDLDGSYYTFDVVNSGVPVFDVPDPYGVSFGVNGLRSMVLDLDRTDPEGWDQDAGVDGYTNPNEAIIYELHVRDLTSQNAWGGPEEYQGTYMGLTVRGTTYTNPISNVTVSTGLDHMIELGITHVHLLPTYDQDWNDERNFQFNWGYNPQHYNSPEGGYSTDPFDGAVRVNEFKQMVMALHQNGINVITDMVYNHTGPGASYSFNRIVPGYIYRFNSDGSWSNGTGVGNETASERYMFRKFMVDSMVYWAEEYHIDGFRYDLMAVHDYETMNAVSEAVEAVDPDIFVYGEPWGGGTIALPYDLQAGKHNLWRMPLVAAFNDEIRNAIKGSPDGDDSGYITNGQNIYTVMAGIAGNQLGSTSSQSVNYVTAHDNLTLYDKLKSVHKTTGYTETIDYEARLANSIVLFSQGIPFLHAGVDFLRTKGGDHNSYESSDLVNQLNWVRKSMYVDSFEYYQGIIAIRKEFDSFKMQDRTDINNHLTFLYPDGYGLIGYRLTKNGEDILIYHNGGAQKNDIQLPGGAWTLIADRDTAGLDPIGTYATRYPIEEAETLVFVAGDPGDVEPSPMFAPEITSAFGVVFEGATFQLTSSTDIYAYSINGGDYITVDSPSTTIPITGLAVGFHTIRIKDAFGTESDPFDLQVLARTTEPEAPEILDTATSIEAGTDLIVTSSKPIVSYTLNGGDAVTLDTPSTTMTLTGLTAGNYTLTVTDEDGLASDPFLFTVNAVENPVTCEDGYELIGDECVPTEDIAKTTDTGCFGGIQIRHLWAPAVLTLGALGILLFRKRM
jgi:pullulanase